MNSVLIVVSVIVLMVLALYGLNGQEDITKEQSRNENLIFNQPSILQTMEPTTVTIRATETITVEGLTIKNNGGGHTIERDGNDKLFAEMIFSRPEAVADGTTQTKELPMTIYAEQRGEEIIFEGYMITVGEVGWNGETVTLSVQKR